MTVNTGQPYGPIANQGVKACRCWKFITIPKHLVPATSLHPLQFGIIRGEIQHSLRRFGFCCGADEIYPQQSQPV